MKAKTFYLFIPLMLLTLTACGLFNKTKEPQVNDQQVYPTLDAPSGTVVEKVSSSLMLSHPEFNWKLTLPNDWTITYDAGYQVNANSPDQTIFVRLQSQRWKGSERPSSAQAYVEHWKNFSYGNVFPLFANGTQVSETEVGQDKVGSPYLQYEFDDGNKKVRYLQIYASAGGPTSAMVTTWTTYDSFDKAKNVMQSIINSFELTENAQ